MCVAVGAIAGFGAVGFYWMLSGVRWVLLDWLVGWRPEGPAGDVEIFPASATNLRPWLLAIVPAAGGLIAGLIIFKFAPEAAGHGTDAAIHAYHFKDGSVRIRVPLVKAVTSALTIGSGGSGGIEGPIAQIGSGFGSMIASGLKLSPAERRILMAAGMSAGIGAIFRAPLAGALFAAEVLYRDADLEHEIIVPAFISSIVAYSIFATKFGWSPVFSVPDYVFTHPLQLLPYLALAVVLAVAAVFYIRFFYFCHYGFAKWRIPNYLKPAVGGLLTGIIGLVLYFTLDGRFSAMGQSYGIIQHAFHDPGAVGLRALVVIALAKIVTTSFSIGSGGSGGVFGPSIVIGGCIGGAVGLIAERFLPGLEIEPGAFVVVGMAGFFAAAAHCPISTLIMVGELTGNYHLLVPSMLVCVIASQLTRGHTLYEAQLDSRLDAPSKMGNMMSAVLRKIDVGRAISESLNRGDPEKLITVPEAMSLGSIIGEFAESDQALLPVIGRDESFIGVVDWRDIRRVLGEEGVADLIVARDLMRAPVTIRPEDTLLTAVQRMAKTESDGLVVIDPQDGNRPVAILNQQRIVRAYDDTLLLDRV